MTKSAADAQGITNRLTIGILAHVDAGKTTLSEAVLHTAGVIRRQGRVDHGDAFLDTDLQERRRGITIFSKQAVFPYRNTVFTLLDTPGHVDFSAETERTLQVLDAAVLVISAPEGIQSHTRTLFSLLRRYQVPVFVFVNKMDQAGVNPGQMRERLLEQLNNVFRGGFLDCSSPEALLSSPEGQENLAMLDEALMNRYLEEGIPADREDLIRLIRERELFPCCFGSALREEGIVPFLDLLSCFRGTDRYPESFGARVFKITRDEQGARLTWMKITGGVLRAKMPLLSSGEKAEQLRLYSGTRFTPLKEAEAGTVLAVTGLTSPQAGDGLGTESGKTAPLLSPVLSYAVQLPEGMSATELYPRFLSLMEELPELHAVFDEESKEIRVSIMGTVQTEILKELFLSRFGVRIGFSDAAIAYQETIASKAEGIGHFEPLRHYAEVHLILEPGEAGSGLVFESILPTDRLASNWQHMILNSLREKEHRGVLTGAPLTDVKITLAAGKAHEKHTEGGDFRQAACRAVRNGLMEAESVLLEPWYAFSLLLPSSSVGRAFTDLDRMGAEFSLDAGEMPEHADEGFSCISGEGPVSGLRNYAEILRSYTGGTGVLSLRYSGYRPCRNAEEVIASIGYDPELDLRNSADSVFCSHGSGTVIPWYEVLQYMHLPPVLSPAPGDGAGAAGGAGAYGTDSEDLLSPAALAAREKRRAAAAKDQPLLSVDEIDAIIERTFFANRKRDAGKRRRGPGGRRYRETYVYGTGSGSGSGTKKAGQKSGKEYLLVDGYNIIFAWEELKELARLNVDSAREALLDILSDYQGYLGCTLIAVFDAYRVAGHAVETLDYYNIHVVYTKEAQTADSYIEQFSEAHAKTDRVIVATSDGMEQIIVRSQGSELLSARDLREDILRRQAKAAETLEKKTAEAPGAAPGSGKAPKNRPFEEKLKNLGNSRGIFPSEPDDK